MNEALHRNRNLQRLGRSGAPTLAFAVSLVAFCVAMIAIASAEPATTHGLLLAQAATDAPAETHHHGGHRLLVIGGGIVVVLIAGGVFFYLQQQKKKAA